MFAIFILACGTTHFFEVRILWHPDYWVQGLIKAVTAVVSSITAMLLWPLVPRLLELPSPTQLRQAHEELHGLERQLMHSQKLEALGTLAGGVAHDLNNTLVPILALSKVVLEDLPESSPMRADIETIIRASERARDLVKQILAFSRKRPLANQKVDLALMTREALRMLRASVPASIQIVDHISEVSPVFGDAGQLHQVVINLVTNAAQAIGNGLGKITISLWEAAEQKPLRSDEGGTLVYLSITDTGCGMDEATLNRIFEPFLRPRGSARAPALGFPSCMASSRTMAARSPCRVSPARAPNSFCRCRRSTNTKRSRKQNLQRRTICGPRLVETKKSKQLTKRAPAARRDAVVFGRSQERLKAVPDFPTICSPYKARSQARSALSGDDRYASIGRLKAVGFLGVPKIRGLHEAKYFAGLHTARMPEE
jgi:hypothetical protein